MKNVTYFPNDFNTNMILINKINLETSSNTSFDNIASSSSEISMFHLIGFISELSNPKQILLSNFMLSDCHFSQKVPNILFDPVEFRGQLFIKIQDSVF